jgi:sulfite reductase (NADPH) flavoprotein alpha-component
MAAMAQLDCGACGYICQTYSEAIANGTEKDLTRCSPGGGETAKALKQLVQLSPPAANGNGKMHPVSTTSSATHSRTNPFAAKLIESRRLTHPDAAKDTRHVAIDLLDSGLTYEPGDALGILPLNCPELVAGVLAALRAEGSERVPTSDGGSKSLRDALAGDYSLTRPRAELLGVLAQFAANSDEAVHLRRLIDSGEADEFLAPLDVLDVLNRFASARPPLVEFVAALGKLQPRLYSISSSQRMHAREVHLTVGVVRYESQGKWVHGVASNFLGVRSQPGDEVRVYIQKSPRFRLPADPQTSIIMVGPGTGIAPFRAFLEEREATSARGPSWLIFGNQHFHYDFLYREELDRWCDSGVLTRLDVAFSRDSSQKVYVQDRMRENARELWSWLQRGAYFYVCGDAKKMAVDVDQALQEIVAEQGRMSAADAKAFVQSLVKEKRYLKDVY